MRKIRTALLATVLALSLVAALPFNPRVYAPPPAEGTLLRDLIVSGSSGLGVGFDGTNLYWVDFGFSTMHKIDTMGNPIATIPIVGGQASVISWDAGRGVFWGMGGCSIYQITTAGVATFQFSVTTNCGFVDGMNYDASDDTLWYSNDGAQFVSHVTVSGTPIGGFPINVPPNNMVPECGFNFNSGIAVGAINVMYLAADGCQFIFKYDKLGNKLGSIFISAQRHEDMECDDVTFASQGTDAVWIKDAFDNHIRAFAVADGTCVAGGGGGIEVSKFFTDSSLNPLPLDSNGDPKVDVVLANGVVRSTNPGQVLVWVNVSNAAGAVQSLTVNETIPVDWTVHPPFDPAVGAIHVYFEFADNSRVEISDPSTITTTTGNPETVTISIPNLNATAAGKPLEAGESILISIKIDYALAGTSQPSSNYPVNNTDTASAAGYPDPDYMGTASTDIFTGFFVCYAKVLGDVNNDLQVDLLDVGIVAYAYDASPGHARWNPDADTDKNNVVNLLDLAFVAYNYGTTA